MNDIVSRRASIWREAMRDFVAFAKEEWHLLVIVAAIIAIEQRFIFLNSDFKDIAEQFKQAQMDSGKFLELANKYTPNIIISIIMNAVTTAISAYVFTVFYLRHIAEERLPEFSFKGFLSWLVKIVQKYFILIFPLFLLIAIFGGMMAAHLPEGAQKAASIVFVGLAFCWMCYFYCGLYVLILVSPLAVLRGNEPVLKISAHITKNNLIRIWWESMIVLGILFIAFFPLSSLILASRKPMG